MPGAATEGVWLKKEMHVGRVPKVQTRPCSPENARNSSERMLGEFACLTAAFGREEPPATHFPARAGEFSAAAGALVFCVECIHKTDK